MKLIFNLFKKKLFEENAPLILLIGIAPLLMASKTVMSGLVMATAMGFILVLSCIAVSAVRKFIPDNVRLVAYMMIIATFVALAQLLIRAYLPNHYANLGIYLPIIASAGIVFSRVDAVSSKTGVVISAIDGALTALAFAVIIMVLSLIREFFGSGTILSYRILAEEYGMSFILSPAGGLVLLGLFAALIRKIKPNGGKKEEEK